MKITDLRHVTLEDPIEKDGLMIDGIRKAIKTIRRDNY